MEFFQFRKRREDVQVNRAKRDFLKSTVNDNTYKKPESTTEKAEHKLKHFLRTSHQKMQWQERQEKRKQAVYDFVTHSQPVTSLLETLDPVLQEYQKRQKDLQDSGISFDNLEDMRKHIKKLQTTVGALTSNPSFPLDDNTQDIKAFVEEKNTKMDQAKQQIGSLSLETDNREAKQAGQQVGDPTQDHQKLGPYSDTFVKLMQQKQEAFTKFVKRLEECCRSIDNEGADPSEPGPSSQPDPLIIEASASSHLDTSLKALRTKFQQLLDQIQQKKQDALVPFLKPLQKTVNDLQGMLFQNDGYKYSSANEKKLQNVIKQAEKLLKDSEATPEKLQQENTPLIPTNRSGWKEEGKTSKTAGLLRPVHFKPSEHERK